MLKKFKCNFSYFLIVVSICFIFTILKPIDSYAATHERWVGTYNTGPAKNDGWTINDKNHIAPWKTKAPQRAAKLANEIQKMSSIAGLQQTGIYKLNELCVAFKNTNYKFIIEGRTDTKSYRSKCSSNQVIEATTVASSTNKFSNDMIVFDSSKYTLKSSNRVNYTVSPAMASYRYGYQWAIFTENASKKEFLFINTYLTNKGTNEAAAIKQMNQLISIINGYKKNHKNIIVVGDFNLRYDEAKRKAAVDKLRNSGFSCKPTTGGVTTFDTLGKNKGVILDYVCLTKHIKSTSDSKKVGGKVVVYKSVNGNNKFASDHFMVSRKVDFGKAK